MTDATATLVVPVTRVDRQSPLECTPSGRETVWGYGFIGPWLIGFVIFTAGPMIASFVLSFTNFDLLHPESVVRRPRQLRPDGERPERRQGLAGDVRRSRRSPSR